MSWVVGCCYNGSLLLPLVATFHIRGGRPGGLACSIRRKRNSRGGFGDGGFGGDTVAPHAHEDTPPRPDRVREVSGTFVAIFFIFFIFIFQVLFDSFPPSFAPSEIWTCAA